VPTSECMKRSTKPVGTASPVTDELKVNWTAVALLTSYLSACLSRARISTERAYVTMVCEVVSAGANENDLPRSHNKPTSVVS
jgi:hypothetical protein